MSNQARSYLLYALGEIILVVTGILIALQINNLNEDKKNRRTEHLLFREMSANLRADQEDLDFNINSNLSSLKSNEIVLSFLNGGLPFDDSLSVHFGAIFGSTTFTKNTAAYDNLESIGLDLITDDRLRFQITELYSNRYKYLTRLEENNYEFHTEQVLPQLIEHIDNDPIFVSATPVDPKALALNHSFKEVLEIIIVWRHQMVGIYKDTNEKIQSLIDVINKKLGN